LALANDYPLWWVNADLETEIGVARALDRFGTLSEATVVRSWERPADSTPCRLHVTSFRKGPKELFAVSNLENALCTRKLRIANPPAAASARDLESLATISVSAGEVGVSVPGRDFKLIEATRSGAK
jgi:hypothetical protein